MQVFPTDSPVKSLPVALSNRSVSLLPPRQAIPGDESLSVTVARYLCGLCLLAMLTATAWAQAPVGTISGTVNDESGAIIANAAVTIRNKATGAERRLTSNADGAFSAAALPAGEYEVEAQVTGFRTLKRDATVSTGTVTSVEMQMKVGQTTEVVTIEGSATSQINYESHSIDGVITRQKIQELPLNGRSFLQLAFLEPGVTTSAGSTSQYNSLFSVSVLGGSSDKTAITVDGGTVRNSIEGDTGMNFSQEVVQEFQLSSSNFDLSTGITSVGSVNIVTRTGGNQYHGSGYFFFRDHNMAAYPALNRNPANPDPFFARRNPGFWVGGPVLRDRLFFFTNYEYTRQTQVFTVQPDLPSISGLAGNFASPYSGHLFSARLDWKVSNNHNAFLRYSHDQNKGFGPRGGARLPSNWLQNTNFSDQGILGVTSILKPTLTNDFHLNFTYWRNRNLFADQSVCPNCIGLGFPEISLQGSGNFTVGNTQNATQGRNLRRYTFLDTVTWQKGSHRLRFGGEIEHAPGTGFWGYCDPGCTSLFSPEVVKSLLLPAIGQAGLALYFPKLPSVIKTNDDLLNLPFAGAVIGVGDPAQPPAYNIGEAKQNNRYRWFAQDTWKVRPRFTLNYGLAWNFESTLVNRDLDKPKYLQPLYGSDLSATKNNYRNYSPSLGFAWGVDRSSRTVVRAGAGIYWDTELLWRRLQERAFIGPVGNGRVQYPSTGFTNIYPGIVDFGAGGKLVKVGDPVPQSLTNMTLAQFLEILRQQLPAVQATLAPKNLNDLTVRNIQLNKSAAQLYPHDYPVQRSYHMNIGVQHQLRNNMVLSVDYVRRVYVNTLLGEIDYNRYSRFINGVRTPVMPICSSAQRTDPNAQCASGGITFWTPGGRGVYNGLLVKLDGRFAKRYTLTASYALTGQSGVNGIADLDNWFRSYGPQGARHILNVSALVDLPWGFQLGIISASSSRGPLMPSVSGVDITGDGTTSEPIQGVSYNCFNRGGGKDVLAKAVAAGNAKYPTGSKDARGQAIPQLSLPTNYEFGDNFNSQDVRLTKKFTFREHYTLAVFGEMFNVFNIANLGGYNFTINSGAFGQPTSRASQVFGSGGPRALQIGGRFTF